MWETRWPLVYSFQRENQTQRRHKFVRFLFFYFFWVFILAWVLCMEFSMRLQCQTHMKNSPLYTYHFYDSVWCWFMIHNNVSIVFYTLSMIVDDARAHCIVINISRLEMVGIGSGNKSGPTIFGHVLLISSFCILETIKYLSFVRSLVHTLIRSSDCQPHTYRPLISFWLGG